MNTSLFPTRSHLSPNLAITISVSFAVSVHTSIPNYCNFLSQHAQVSDHPAPTDPKTLLHVLLSKLPNPQNHITLVLRSLHWLKITERIEYKLLSLTYKVLTTTQPSYLHNLITVQPPRSPRSSSLVTLARPSTSPSLRITDRPLLNQLPAPLRQSRTNLFNAASPSSLSGTSSISSLIDLLLSSSVISSLFHSRLKTFLFCKSFPP